MVWRLKRGVNSFIFLLMQPKVVMASYGFVLAYPGGVQTCLIVGKVGNDGFHDLLFTLYPIR